MTARITIHILAALSTLCIAFISRAGIVDLTSQSRSVSAMFTDGTPSQFQLAPDFGPFNAQVGFPRVNAIADQHSTLDLTPDGAVFQALSNVRGSTVTATFASSFHVAFDLTRPADYTLIYAFGAASTGNDTPPTPSSSPPPAPATSTSAPTKPASSNQAPTSSKSTKSGAKTLPTPSPSKPSPSLPPCGQYWQCYRLPRW